MQQLQLATGGTRLFESLFAFSARSEKWSAAFEVMSLFLRSLLLQPIAELVGIGLAPGAGDSVDPDADVSGSEASSIDDGDMIKSGEDNVRQFVQTV